MRTGMPMVVYIKAVSISTSNYTESGEGPYINSQIEQVERARIGLIAPQASRLNREISR